jgi:hypothetical protein
MTTIHIPESITMRPILALPLLAAVLSLCACDSKPAAPATRAAGPAPSLPASFFLASAPADAKPLEDAKKAAKPGDPITLRGRIGGSEEPFVENRAVFTLMGPGLPTCADNPEDKCKIPWDWCCESPEDIAAHAATIQVVDASGQPLKLSMKGQHNLKELSECTVVGTVAHAEGSTLIVNATGIYVASK